MSNNGSKPTDNLIEIRDSGGRLLFKYNPSSNAIEIKKGGDGIYIVKLDEIRQKYGFLPPTNRLAPLGVEMAMKKE